jgi:hypothetical protein
VLIKVSVRQSLSEIWRNTIVKRIVLTLALAVFTTGAYAADEWPFRGGGYWEITGIDVKDGGDWKYSNWLPTEWKQSAEFSKSTGRIKAYMIMGNVHPRKGAPGLYIIRVKDSVVSGAEGQNVARNIRLG